MKGLALAGLEEYVIPSSVTSISGVDCMWATSLKRIVVPNSVSSIDDSMQEWWHVEEIVIGENVTSLGFIHGCGSLQRVYFNSINPPAFTWNKNLFGNSSDCLEIYVPESRIEEYKIVLGNKIDPYVNVVWKEF